MGANAINIASTYRKAALPDGHDLYISGGKRYTRAVGVLQVECLRHGVVLQIHMQDLCQAILCHSSQNLELLDIAWVGCLGQLKLVWSENAYLLRTNQESAWLHKSERFSHLSEGNGFWWFLQWSHRSIKLSLTKDGQRLKAQHDPLVVLSLQRTAPSARLV